MKKILLLFFCFILLASPLSAKELNIVQIADLNFSLDNKKLEASFDKTIEDINKRKDVDVIVFTGDNISSPNKTDLKNFLNLANKFKKPYLIVMGDKEFSNKNLSKAEYFSIVKEYGRWQKNKKSFLVYKVNKDFVILYADGVKNILPSKNGYYKKVMIDILNKNIKDNKDKKIIIMQHFPIIKIEDDSYKRAYEPENYLQMLKTHKNVVAIISGGAPFDKELQQDGITHILTSSFNVSPSYPYKIITINYNKEKTEVSTRIVPSAISEN